MGSLKRRRWGWEWTWKELGKEPGIERTKRRPGTGEARAFQWSLMPPPGGDRFRHGFRRRVRRANGVVVLAPHGRPKSSHQKLTLARGESVTVCRGRRSSGADP